MSDRIFTADETYAAFRFASHWWRSLVGSIDGQMWDRPGLGEWSVRELVAHTDRAYLTIVDYTEGETKDPTPIESAAQYFRTVLAEETPHLHIAARAKKEAAARADWVTATDELAERAEKRVAELPGDAICHLFVGEMPLDQYLATRVVELVVHGLDLSDAVALPTDPPPSAAAVTMGVLGDLASKADTASVLRFMTGRPARLLPNVLD